MVETFNKISVDLGLGFFTNAAIAALLSLKTVYKVKPRQRITPHGDGWYKKRVFRVDFNRWLKTFIFMYVVYVILVLIVRLW
jgi:hypothetical protein